MAQQAIKEVALVPAQPEPMENGLAAVIERLVTNPAADVDKLGRLLEFHERITAQRAKAEFDAALSAAQAEMGRVGRDAVNPQTRSRYASYGALDRALRPIYTRHGFGLSFNSGEAPLPEHVRVLCEVTHSGGFAKSYHLDMPADGKGAKGGDVMTKTHAVGSAMSYGMRYLLKMIFNVAVGEGDDDGNGAGGKPQAAEPDGLETFWDDLTTIADSGGIDNLKKFWSLPKHEPLRNYVLKHKAAAWAALKQRAEKVKA